ncbi:hypothetical protein [Nocardia sp. NPDC051833]|uniref:DoxX family protein n=1 Tax=Nocardia sp. NPDC051833 TaxID=3155674 RepID=UPI0034468247
MSRNMKGPNRFRALGQASMGALLGAAGIGHLTFLRQEFRAQVPQWLPVDPDLVVVASGVIEVGLGSALLATWNQPRRAIVGGAVAAFFVAIFPGNIAQLVNHVDAFGLDTDAKRLVRLAFQPLLVVWVLAATDSRRVLREHRALRNRRTF